MTTPENEPSWEEIANQWAEEIAKSDSEQTETAVTISSRGNVLQWMSSREWDFTLPAACKDCPEANCDINVVQDLIHRMKDLNHDPTSPFTPENLYRTAKAYLAYIEATCSGMTTPTMSRDDPYIKAEFDVDNMMPEPRPDEANCPLDINIMQFLAVPPELRGGSPDGNA